MTAICVVDLGFGDCGKGTIVDWMCSPVQPYGPVPLVVRFNGGPQAAHNVFTPDGREHTFAMFGSGTFHNVPTYLSEHVFINPFNILNEARHLEAVGIKDPLRLLRIDRFCPVITPYHQVANQLREKARDADRHGSCGHGFGETVNHWVNQPDLILYARQLRQRNTVRAKLLKIRAWLYDTFGLDADRHLPGVDELVDFYHSFAEMTALTVAEATLPLAVQRGTVVFEGSQGVLLDEWHGFHPYTTWSTTTPKNALSLLNRIVSRHGAVHTVGVVRAHMTRHGPGPFPSESKFLTEKLPDPSNTTGPWQGAFRVGHFDPVLHRYAIACCGEGPERIGTLAVTHLDHERVLPTHGRVVADYMYNGATIKDLVAEPVVLKDEAEQLARQAERTELLMNVTPTWKYLDNAFDPIEYAQLLRLPLEIGSYGPTWADKRSPLSYGRWKPRSLSGTS